MGIHAYDVLTPITKQMLPALDRILGKGETFVQENGLEERVLLQYRLAPDMFDFTRQIQIATDQIKGGFARLAGQESPSWPDTESSFAELRARVQKTIAFAGTFNREQFDDAADRDIQLKFPGVTLDFKGEEYLLGFVLPNFYFHMTTGYDILRHNGVGLGKAHFLGG